MMTFNQFVWLDTLDRGLIHHEPHRDCLITEKGKIAHALQAGMNARQRRIRQRLAA